MKIKTYYTCLVAFVMCAVLLGMDKAHAAKTQKEATTCKACHSSSSQVLPKDHPVVSTLSLGACLKCHQPSLAGKPEKNAFFTSLHVAHAKAKTACSTCHIHKAEKLLGLKGTKVSLGKPSREGMMLIERTTASWADSTNLDAIHAKNKIGCAACHGKQLPEKGDTVENERCIICHGSYEALAVKTKNDAFPKKNPHKSHLGEIGCVVCHQSHNVSTSYCNGCHVKFNMKIPGGSM